MQIIFEDKVKGSNGRGTGTVDFVIHVRRIGRYMEGECDGRNEGRGSGI